MLLQLHHDPATGAILPLLDGTEEGWRLRAQGIMDTAQAVRDAAPGTVLVGWDGTYWYRGTRGWASGATAQAAQAAWQAQDDAGWPEPWRRAAQASVPGVRGTRGQSRKAQRARSHCPTCSHPWAMHRGLPDGHPTDYGWCSCTATRPTPKERTDMTRNTATRPELMPKARMPKAKAAHLQPPTPSARPDTVAEAILAAHAAGTLDTATHKAYLQHPDTFKLCGGWPKWKLMAHAAPKADFPRNAANPDGLAGACRPCNAAYRQLRRQAQGGAPIEVKISRDPQAAAAAIDTQLKAMDRVRGAKAAAPVVVDGTAAQAAEHAALDAQLSAVGGAATDQGQAILADAAAQAARARKDARNATQRAWRASKAAQAKADLPTTTAEFTSTVRDILGS